MQLWEFEEVKRVAPARVQRILDFALLTGQRPMDIRNARWSDVKEDGIYMLDYKKKKEPYLIPWSPGLRAFIDDLRQNKILGLYLFPTSRYTRSGFSSAFTSAMEKALANGKLKEPFQFRDIRALTCTIG